MNLLEPHADSCRDTADTLRLPTTAFRARQIQTTIQSAPTTANTVTSRCVSDALLAPVALDACHPYAYEFA
jgi:hypothetical protein